MTSVITTTSMSALTPVTSINVSLHANDIISMMEQEIRSAEIRLEVLRLSKEYIMIIIESIMGISVPEISIQSVDNMAWKVDLDAVISPTTNIIENVEVLSVLSKISDDEEIDSV